VILPDVNVLVYAFDADAVGHSAYSEWLGRSLTGREDFALSDPVLSGFVRIVTHPKIMPKPAPTNRALEFVSALIDAPASRWLVSSAATWSTFGRLTEGDRAIKANLVPDAYLAAVALTNGARIATADRGFARFPGVSWFDPA
jgi:toxin-antitoxin system PIN domain toxin